MVQATSGGRVDFRRLVDAMSSTKLPNYAFHNRGDLTFSNESAAWGLDTPTFSSGAAYGDLRSEEHTSELQSRLHLVCRLLLEKKKNIVDDVQRRIHVGRRPRVSDARRARYLDYDVFDYCYSRPDHAEGRHLNAEASAVTSVGR